MLANFARAGSRPVKSGLAVCGIILNWRGLPDSKLEMLTRSSNYFVCGEEFDIPILGST